MDHVLRVYLADHSAGYLQLIRGALERQRDLRVVGCATRGGEAYRQILRLKPDVLVTEVVLPALDGLSLLQRLRDDDRLPCTLVLSAFVNDYITGMTSLAGARDFLQKPCDVALLAHRIRAAAGSGSLLQPRNGSPVVREILARYGVPFHLAGCAYLMEALRMVYFDRSLLRGVTKILYPELGRQFHATAGSVEHSIRCALLAGWEAESPARRREYFGAAFDRFTSAPSNARFLAIAAAYLEQVLSQSCREGLG